MIPNPDTDLSMKLRAAKNTPSLRRPVASSTLLDHVRDHRRDQRGGADREDHLDRVEEHQRVEERARSVLGNQPASRRPIGSGAMAIIAIDAPIAARCLPRRRASCGASQRAIAAEA